MTGTSLVDLDEGDPDNATGTQPLCFIEHSKHDMRIGYYSDTYVRTDDGWRLKTRAMTFIRRSGDHDPAARTRSAGPKPDDRALRDAAGFRHRRVPVEWAWLDENDLTPPPGDHSLDAHQAQHFRVLKRAVRRGLDALRLAGIGGRARRTR